MGNVFSWLRRPKKREQTASLWVGAPGYGLASFNGGCLGVSTAYRCVRLIAESVAQLPFRYLTRGADGVFSEPTGAKAETKQWLLSVQPMPQMNAFDFWFSAVTQMLIKGNAYIVPGYDETGLSRLHLCSEGTVCYDSAAGVYTVSDTWRGLEGTFTEGDVIHLKNMATDGQNGVGVITHARLTMQCATAAAKEAYNRSAHGGTMKGFVTGLAGLTGVGETADDAVDSFAAELDRKINEIESRNIVSIPGELKFTPCQMSAADNQFMEERRFEVREVCRFFGVHPSFVFDDTSNNYKSVEMANVDFLTHTLNPILAQIETEFNRKLLRRGELPRDRKYEFDRMALFATDMEGKMRISAAMLGCGMATVNELRRMGNRPAVEGGDRPLVSANLREIGDDEDNNKGNGMPEGNI